MLLKIDGRRQEVQYFSYSGELDTKGNAFGRGVSLEADRPSNTHEGTWADNKYHGISKYIRLSLTITHSSHLERCCEQIYGGV